MQVIRSLWSSIQQDPLFMRRVNGWLTIFWIGMIPVSIIMGWLTSVAYVSALSLWALVSGHWAAWQAARVEVNQEREDAERHSQSKATNGSVRTAEPPAVGQALVQPESEYD